MAFVVPMTGRRGHRRSVHLPKCCARPPKPPHSAKAMNGASRVDDSDGNQGLHSMGHISEKVDVLKQPIPSESDPPWYVNTGATKRKDVWDSLIDDSTRADDFLNPGGSQGDEEYIARLARKANDKQNPAEAAPQAKPKRGRPKGSKNRKSAVKGIAKGEAARKAKVGRNDGDLSLKGVHELEEITPEIRKQLEEELERLKYDFQIDGVNTVEVDEVDDDEMEDFPFDMGDFDARDVDMRAPNGLPGNGEPDDFLPELVSVFAKMEAEKKRKKSPREKHVRALLRVCSEQFSSTHRASGRLENLKPYTQRKLDEHICEKCEGKGMTKCDYCKGMGFVDLGEGGKDFEYKFKNVEFFVMPTHVMGNIYHCPLCGGLQKERCDACEGTGEITNPSGKRSAGASRKRNVERAWETFDVDEFVEEEKERVEVGVNGTIILRAKKRGPRKKKAGGTKAEAKARAVALADAQAAADAARQTGPVKRKRGRPRKTVVESADTSSEAVDYAKNVRYAPDLSKLGGRRKDDGVMGKGRANGRANGRALVPRQRIDRRTGQRSTDFVNTTDYQVGRGLRGPERGEHESTDAAHEGAEDGNGGEQDE